MTRPMPGPPEKYQLLGPMVIVWEGGNGYYYHPSLMDAKRLTDAECTAHYWQALAERLEHDADVNCGYETPDDTLEHRAEVWHRFAHTPHALEEA